MTVFLQGPVRTRSPEMKVELTPQLFALWQCQFQAWVKEEGGANGLCYHSVVELQLGPTSNNLWAVIGRKIVWQRPSI